MSNNGKGLPEVLANHEADLLADWIKEQAAGAPRRAGTIRETELRDQSKEFLSLLKVAVKNGSLDDIQGAGWSDVRGMLSDLSRSRGGKASHLPRRRPSCSPSRSLCSIGSAASSPRTQTLSPN